jgi:hypothetical protein
MATLNPLEVYRLLPKTNCGECGLAACMAFALAVVNSERALADCPHVDGTVSAQAAGIRTRQAGEGFQASVDALRERFRSVEPAEATGRLGVAYGEERFRVRCLGRDFVIDGEGRLESDCHVNLWMETILLSYLTSRGSGPLAGGWASLEELRGGPGALPYFRRRFEEPLRAIADQHTATFFDLLRIFGAVPAEGLEADRAEVLHPLPKVPYLVLYWAPEEGFPSRLRVLFDRTADSYLSVEVLTFIGRGIVQMFQKIVARHDEYEEKLLYL